MQIHDYIQVDYFGETDKGIEQLTTYGIVQSFNGSIVTIADECDFFGDATNESTFMCFDSAKPTTKVTVLDPRRPEDIEE